MKIYILVMILIAGAFFTGRYFDTVRKYSYMIMKQIKRLELKTNIWSIAAIAAVFLVMGIFIGRGAKLIPSA